jgi:hypothetical protein
MASSRCFPDWPFYGGIKHALGLANKLKIRFELHYIYYDCPGPEAQQQWAELCRFSKQVDSGLKFKAITYQELFDRLVAQSGSIDSGCIDYLRQRYF